MSKRSSGKADRSKWRIVAVTSIPLVAGIACLLTAISLGNILTPISFHSFVKEDNTGNLDDEPPAAKIAHGRSGAISPYDEYIRAAEQSGRRPIDPIERLTQVIKSFESGLDYVDPDRLEETKSLANMKYQEIIFITDILKRSTERTFDLIPILYTALNTIKGTIFRVMKEMLRLGVSREVTQEEAEEKASEWMYLPIKTLLSLVAQARAENMAHIIANVNDTIHHSNGLNLLSFSTQHRLWRLVTLFLTMECDSETAMRMAITNCDEVTVNLILQHWVKNGIPFNPTEYVEMSLDLGYHHIGKLVALAVSNIDAHATDPSESFKISDEYSEVEDMDEVGDNSEERDTRYGNDNGGYMSQPELLVPNQGTSKMCRIARLDLQDILSNSSVFLRYLSLNKPFLVDLWDDNTTFTQLRSMYSYSSIQNVTNRIRVSDIPYGKHYSRFVHDMTVSQFLVEEMRKTTNQILFRFQEKISVNNSFLREVKTPLYVFGSSDDAAIIDSNVLRSFVTQSPMFIKLLSALTNGPLENANWIVQNYLGPIFSGAPFHLHGPALNLIVFGKKRWSILPPAKAVFSSMSPLETLVANEKSLLVSENKDMSCWLVQRSGELFFSPRHWSHQVINLQETVGFAIEVLSYR